MKKRISIDDFHYSCQIHTHQQSLPYLLMLHGFMGDSRVFSHLLHKLKSSCNPITIDLLGHGESDKPSTPVKYREEELVSQVISLIGKLELSPLFLYGYSMGGRLALKTAQAEPDLFKGLILESSTFGIIDKDKRIERREADRKRAESIKDDFAAFLKQWEALPLFSSTAGERSDLSEIYEMIHAEQNPEAMAAVMRGFSTGAMKAVTKDRQNYYHPVLLVAGSEDRKYVALNEEMKSLFPNATLKIIEAGHRVHLDNPEALCKEINSFIEQNA
ncbi:MAG: 2-succinyl-6-hydroxy-2,4-cyclohexadiene-1-carboxylate synthase [Balneolaceae bacterium]|nr:2-succinyl-6-hydroxy-2,4-cyclohexadiene-1-carboxylate synthase [Balneolaceae bacterium]